MMDESAGLYNIRARNAMPRFYGMYYSGKNWRNIDLRVRLNFFCNMLLSLCISVYIPKCLFMVCQNLLSPPHRSLESNLIL